MFNIASFSCNCINRTKSISRNWKFHSKHLTTGAVFSSNPALQLQDAFPHFRTIENNPTLHTKDHVGKYYLMPPDVKSKLFLSGGIPGRLNIQMKTFREAGIMIRNPAIEIMSYLKKINLSDPVVRFVIYGKNGTGKTCTMVHLLHFAYESNFLLVHLPWVSNWTKRPKELVVSQYNEKRFDLPVESAIWLQHFKSQNSHLMEGLNLKTSKSYTWSKREVTEQGSNLMEIVEHGIQRVRHSSDCVGALLKEIKLNAQAGNCKVMVMVDGVNAFWSKANVKPNKTKVEVADLTVAHAFKKILQNDWNNGIVITSVDIMPFDRDGLLKHPYTPRFLLGKEGFELLCPFVPILTENYTDKEIHSVLDYYCDRLWLQSEKARGEEGRKQIKFLSGYNPYEVMKVCDPL